MHINWDFAYLPTTLSAQLAKIVSLFRTARVDTYHFGYLKIVVSLYLDPGKMEYQQNYFKKLNLNL